jgi:hypothetical protein
MSVANLLVPNDYDLYMNELTVTTLNVVNIYGVTGATGPYISPLYSNEIDTPPAGPDNILSIGADNADAIQFGNTGSQNQFYGEIQFPTIAGNISPYNFSDSKADATIATCNYAGTFTQNGVSCSFRVRRIGNWVDLYFNALGFSVSSGATFNNSLQLGAIIPVGYRPLFGFAVSCPVLSNSTYTNGICFIGPDGSMTFAILGTNPPSFSGGNYNVGAVSAVASYTIN